MNSKANLTGSDNERDDKIDYTKNVTNSVIRSALTINTLHDNQLDIPTAASNMVDAVLEIRQGNLAHIETMLLCQAETLNTLFHQIITRMENTNMINQV